MDMDEFLKRTASGNGPAEGQPARRRGRRAGGNDREIARCSRKTQDKFAIASMARKLLHRCTGAHAREFQTKLLHYFFLSNNKSNLHYAYAHMYIHISTTRACAPVQRCSSFLAMEAIANLS